MIALVLAITVFLSLQLNKLQFNYDFEAFFPNEDNELELYNNYRKEFEYDNEFVMLAIENRSGVFRKDFLKKTDSLSSLLAKVPDIKRISSPTNLKITKFDGLVPRQVPLLHFAEPDRYLKDSAAIYNSPFIVGSYFPKDAKSICVFIKTADALSKNKSDSLAARIDRQVQAFHFDAVHSVGRIFAQRVYLQNIQREFSWFLALSSVIVIIFLWLTFKRPYGVVVPVIVVLISIVWTLGFMALAGKPVDIMIVMLPTMIFIAGMSDVVHFLAKYFEEQAKGTPVKEIYPLILKEVGFPTFLTLVTTAVGFLSLLFSSMQPIRDFGIYTSVGVCFAFILSYSLLPAIIYFFKPVYAPFKKKSEKNGHPWLAALLVWILRRQKGILVVTVTVLILTGWGISKIKINNVLLEDLNDKVKVKQDFKYFDEHYSGVRPFEMFLTVKDSGKTVWDYEIIKSIHKIDLFISKEYGAGFLLSPAALVSQVYLESHMDTLSDFPDQEEYQAIQQMLLSNKNNKEIRRLVSRDGKNTRISAKTRDVGSLSINIHNQKLLQYLNDSLPQNPVSITITGAAHLMDRNNEYMVNNMLQGFVFSLLVIGALTFFLHRSLRMVLIFILPNFIPLIVIAGIMGFAGIELKAATSLVFSIAFGIATDDTIHFISRLKIELAYGKSLLYATKRTFLETGRPIVLTTFILMGGFVSLMTSNFESTFYFGFLICITMFVALIADLFLLPVLLMLIMKRIKATSGK